MHICFCRVIQQNLCGQQLHCAIYGLVTQWRYNCEGLFNISLMFSSVSSCLLHFRTNSVGQSLLSGLSKMVSVHNRWKSLYIWTSQIFIFLKCPTDEDSWSWFAAVWFSFRQHFLLVRSGLFQIFCSHKLCPKWRHYDLKAYPVTW